jgi:prophage regulatory protein
MRFLSVQQVSEQTNLGVSTIWRLVQQNKFPKPVRPGVRRAVWSEDDIAQWQQDKNKAAGE